MFLPLSVCRLSGAKCPPAGADLGHDRQRQRRARSSHTRNATTRRHAHIYQGEVHTATRCSAATTRPPRSGHPAPRMRRRRSVWAAAASSEECEQHPRTNNHARLPLPCPRGATSRRATKAAAPPARTPPPPLLARAPAPASAPADMHPQRAHLMLLCARSPRPRECAQSASRTWPARHPPQRPRRRPRRSLPPRSQRRCVRPPVCSCASSPRGPALRLTARAAVDRPRGG
jgi:hypothetical protein